MVKIRLKRLGRKNHPFWRINAIDARSPRDGKVLEELGYYDPTNKDKAKQVVVDKARVDYWIKVGAQPSDRVAKFLSQAEMMKPRERRDQTKKPLPRAKAQERMKAAAAAAPAEGAEKEAAAS